MAAPCRLLPLVCTFLAVLAWPVRADDGEQAAETFNALFGADLARVRKTGDARDDAALAARLLDTAKKATDQPAFLALVCETAANLGLAHPDGYAAAGLTCGRPGTGPYGPYGRYNLGSTPTQPPNSD